MKKSNWISKAIKRKGALTNRAKLHKRTIYQQAIFDKTNGTSLQKKQANFYLNTLRPINKKNKKRNK